jgi:ATP phosphoribosyltransferase regulatory subunit HisZ
MLGVHADITPQIARIDAKQGSDKIQTLTLYRQSIHQPLLGVAKCS